MRLVSYRNDNPISEGKTWITFWEKNGQFLPVYFCGSTIEVAEGRAKAFWEEENAKKQASEERVKAWVANRQEKRTSSTPKRMV